MLSLGRDDLYVLYILYITVYAFLYGLYSLPIIHLIIIISNLVTSTKNSKLYFSKTVPIFKSLEFIL